MCKCADEYKRDNVRIGKYADERMGFTKIYTFTSMHTPEKENLILKLSFQFALDIIEFTEDLESKRKYNLANQLFKSGTFIGANVREAQGFESKADFVHKLKIAYKEAEETGYWLQL
jgi:hypothetical protein